MTAPFLSIIGIGEDGISGLSVAAATLIAQASLVIGGARHLALADSLITGARETWPNPIADILPRLRAHRPTPTVILASGDPFCFGVGTMLAESLPQEDWHCLPAPSCLTLACARLGWAQQDCAVISFCGRPLAPLATLLQPNTRLFALSADAKTPDQVAIFLRDHGFGASEITLLEAIGGPQERIRTTTADNFAFPDIHKLNLLALTLRGTPGLSLAPGRDDTLFDHDGQITKSEIRATTLAALAPRHGDCLWDIGTGSGAIAIEWMLCHPTNSAIAIDRHPDRLARATANAHRLGVPAMLAILGTAPEALAGLPPPNAVFIGGGAQTSGVIDTAWAALRPGGRLVANSVTIETDTVLHTQLRHHGGTLTRIAVERLTALGAMHGYRPAMTVTQWAATKP